MAKQKDFIIGIDLGTTNCAVTYVDTRELTEDEAPEIQIFEIPQITGPGTVEELSTLPSFTYIGLDQEQEQGQLNLPWVEGREFCVGSFARGRGEELPGRFVHSAKSWLCHEGIDRQGSVLPVEASDGVQKFSPVEATSYYLQHIVESWNHIMADEDESLCLENQDVLITVPASFDPAAKDLTVKAAKMAGIKNLTLLEEPQAAFYHWLYQNPEDWRKIVKTGDTVLVFDMGGGTSDFSLIAVTEEGGDLSLNRFAVGEHILLGGDNMDMAIAAMLRTRLKEEGNAIDRSQFRRLCALARDAKEKLLVDPDLDEVPVTLLGKGRSVVASSIKTTLSRDDLEPLILDGFFPEVEKDEMPEGRQKSGLTELGLPYASDPAVTRHLAAFLTRHADNETYRSMGKSDDFVHPSAILFNGGVMKAEAFQERVTDTLAGWLDGGDLTMLEGEDLDLAVAFGASYYGLVKRGRGIRIRGGTGRSYYVGLETPAPAIPGMEPPMKAVCLVPAKTEEGTSLPLAGREFGLTIGEEAVFRFLSSDVRKEEAVGEALDEDDWDDQLEELEPLVMTLDADDGEAGTVIPVTIESVVTETGTVEVWCVARGGKRRWKLEFNFRDAEEGDEEEVEEEEEEAE